MEIIERSIYLNHIVSLLGRKMMLILVGQRRVGKSYILKLLQQWIESNKQQSKVLYINKELYAFS